MTTRMIGGERVPQIPVIREGFIPYTGRLHWKTGIMCPSCCRHEIVYNGNYFCGGGGNEWPEDCAWALPHWDLDPSNLKYDEPRPMWNLVDALVEAGTKAVQKAP